MLNHVTVLKLRHKWNEGVIITWPWVLEKYDVIVAIAMACVGPCAKKW